MNQYRLTRLHFQIGDGVVWAMNPRMLRADGAAILAKHPQPVASRNHLETAVRPCCWIERDPDCDQRIPVKLPDIAAILVPRQISAIAGGFIHQHSPENRDAGMPAVVARADFAEQVVTDEVQGHWIDLQTLYFPVCESDLG